ncbi:MAG: PIN domain-containing protein [Chloroflexota bacterium]
MKRNQSLVAELTRYKIVLRDLQQSGINIISLSYKELHSGRIYREKYGLLANDSLIVAAMKKEQIRHLATNDRDFGRLPDITVWYPPK